MGVQGNCVFLVDLELVALFIGHIHAPEVVYGNVPWHVELAAHQIGGQLRSPCRHQVRINRRATLGFRLIALRRKLRHHLIPEQLQVVHDLLKGEAGEIEEKSKMFAVYF